MCSTRLSNIIANDIETLQSSVINQNHIESNETRYYWYILKENYIILDRIGKIRNANDEFVFKEFAVKVIISTFSTASFENWCRMTDNQFRKQNEIVLVQ